MIRLIDVHKDFGTKRVLSGFSLDVVEGETMVIIGYSGTGKSVAIKHIVGLLEPDAGQVYVDGLEVPSLPRKELYALRARSLYSSRRGSDWTSRPSTTTRPASGARRPTMCLIATDFPVPE